jgi:hypothetical protein
MLMWVLEWRSADIFSIARAGVISFEEGLKSGLTHAHVQRADSYGGGFFVNVEGMHHLHCLVCLCFNDLQWWRMTV